MKIGILGTGTVGKTLAAKFTALGHQIVVANSRGPAGVREALGSQASAVRPASVSEVFGCEIVFLAVRWVNVRDVLASASADGTFILVDTTNIFLSYPPDAQIDDLNGDSGSEIVARLTPHAHVVKAFNTLSFMTMFAPLPKNTKRVLFVAGDHAPAVATVADLISELGMHPVHLGSLAEAGRQMELGGPLSGPELLKLASASA